MIWFTGLGFILGMVLGSFGLVLADRSLGGKSFLGRSYCPECKKTLRWYDLFPVLSYLLLRGKCRFCHKKIPLEYPLIEIIMGGLIAYLFAYAYHLYSPLIGQYKTVLFVYYLLSGSFIITVLVVLAITDLKKTIIPDRITYPSIIITLLLLLGISGYKIWYYYTSLMATVLGKLLVAKSDFFIRHVLWEGTPINNLAIVDPLVNGLIMASVIGIFFLSLILVTKGRGMGGGDLKLGILLGLYFGFPQAIIVIMVAFFAGSVIALLLLILQRRHFGQTIPFGPFLSFGGIVALFWGQQLFSWYLHLQLP